MADVNLRWNGVDLDEIFLKTNEEYLLPTHLNPGILYSTGANETGQLGLNDIVTRSSPVQVGTNKNWVEVASGNNHSYFLKSDRTLWGCGYNAFYQLGNLASFINASSPIQIATTGGYLTSIKEIKTNGNTACAITLDGALWTWGQERNGTSGQNIAFAGGGQVTPGQVGTSWSTADIYFHGLAVKTNGTLWSWGENLVGELGQNNRTNRSSPVQVGTDTNWKKVFTGFTTSYAIKTDGSLWSWGDNIYGSLGQNIASTVKRSSPVQIGTSTDWKEISTNQYAVCALKTNGTLWVWGLNDFGQLGLNNTTLISSPVQLGGLTNWYKVSCSTYGVLAIKTDGTLWGWGGAAAGMLGTNDIIIRSSPIQIGTLTNWRSVGVGDNQSVLLTY